MNTNDLDSDSFPDLSVVLVTLNEEKLLEQCLQSLPPGSEVVVLDSGSTDSTVDIARRHGARVENHPFANYADQKNAAIALATRKWILSIDADEVLDDTLRAAVENIVSNAGYSSGPSGYSVRRELIFMGQHMRFGKTRDYPLRLFRRGEGSFVSAIHEKIQLNHGRSARLNGTILHHSYDDLTDYFCRFNDYTSRVAANHMASGRRRPLLLAHLLRPWAEFLIRYLFRLGFLDGYPGYCYALLSSYYMFVKYAKLRELMDNPQG